MPITGPLRTGDPSLLRQLNLSVVMHYLRERAPVYRAQLAEITGLNKTTVSSLVSELMQLQFVREVGARTNGGTGRPAMMLELNPAAGCAVAADIGVDFISVAVANFTAQVIWRQIEYVRSSEGQPVVLNRLLALLHAAVERGMAETNRLLGIALGAPGLVDLETGALLFAPNLHWEDVPLRQILAAEFQSPIFVDNEANLAALGETTFGAARGYRDVLYISAGVGLGGGIVRDGRIHRGATGFAGEFGHMTLFPNGIACSCSNRGCWETVVSERALYAEIRRAVEAGRPTLLSGILDRDGEPVSVAAVVEAAHEGDGVALEALAGLGTHLGTGIAALVNALNPELVVLGGTLSLAGEFVLPAIQAEMERRSLRWNRAAAKIVLAHHRHGPSVMGGIVTVLQAADAGSESLGNETRWQLAPGASSRLPAKDEWPGRLAGTVPARSNASRYLEVSWAPSGAVSTGGA